MSTFTDPRDEETYKTVKIGKQIWLAENLRYKGPMQKFNDWTVEKKGFYYCPNGDRRNIKNYGCLYTWDNALKAIPDGWHLPSKIEFENFLKYIEKNKTSTSAFLALIDKSMAWANYYELLPQYIKDKGGDDFSFSARPAGFYHSDRYYFFGSQADFWSTTVDANNANFAYTLDLNGGSAFMYESYKSSAFSVRCIKD